MLVLTPVLVSFFLSLSVSLSLSFAVSNTQMKMFHDLIHFFNMTSLPFFGDFSFSLSSSSPLSYLLFAFLLFSISPHDFTLSFTPPSTSHHLFSSLLFHLSISPLHHVWPPPPSSALLLLLLSLRTLLPLCLKQKSCSTSKSFLTASSSRAAHSLTQLQFSGASGFLHVCVCIFHLLERWPVLWMGDS